MLEGTSHVDTCCRVAMGPVAKSCLAYKNYVVQSEKGNMIQKG